MLGIVEKWYILRLTLTDVLFVEKYTFTWVCSEKNMLGTSGEVIFLFLRSYWINLGGGDLLFVEKHILLIEVCHMYTRSIQRKAHRLCVLLFG